MLLPLHLSAWCNIPEGYTLTVSDMRITISNSIWSVCEKSNVIFSWIVIGGIICIEDTLTHTHTHKMCEEMTLTQMTDS